MSRQEERLAYDRVRQVRGKVRCVLCKRTLEPEQRRNSLLLEMAPDLGGAAEAAMVVFSCQTHENDEALVAAFLQSLQKMIHEGARTTPAEMAAKAGEPGILAPPALDTDGAQSPSWP